MSIEEEFPSILEDIEEAKTLRDEANDNLTNYREELKRVQRSRAEAIIQFEELERRANDNILQLEDHVSRLNVILTDLIKHLDTQGRA